jgi:nitrogen-specific signal transduction histidine kinase
VQRLVLRLGELIWLLLAIGLTSGLENLLVALLCAWVAVIALDGSLPATACAVAGAAGGLLALSGLRLTEASVAVAAGQAILVVAIGGASRLVAGPRRRTAPQVGVAPLEAHRALLEAVSDPVLLVATDSLEIRGCNAAAVNALGAGADDDRLVGQRLDQVLDFGTEGELEDARRRVTEGDAVRDLAATIRADDGQTRSLLLNLALIHMTPDAGCLQVVARALPDVSAAPASRPAHDYVSHLIPSLTHELNSHLGTIRLSAELACATGTMPDCQVLQEEVGHCQRVLQTVVTQMLRASAPPTDDTDEPPQTNLAQAIENAVMLTQPQVLGNDIDLQVRLPQGPLPPVVVHLHEVQEALVRIILRSAQSLHELAPPRKLSCGVTVQEGSVVLVVAHAGSGLRWGELAAANGQEGANPRGDDRIWTVIREGLTRFGGSLTASNSVAGGVRFRIVLPTADPGEERSSYVHAG